MPKLEVDCRFTQRANADTGAADATIHPWVARAAIDLGYAHVYVPDWPPGQRIGGTNIHALSTQGAGLLLRVDVGRADLRATVALMEIYALRRANLAAQTAADTGCYKRVVVF